MGGWTIKQVETLKAMAGNADTATIARAVDRTPSSVINKAFKLGISLQFSYVGCPWLMWELNAIYDAIATGKTAEEVVALIPRHTPNSVRLRFYTESKRMGVTRKARAVAKGFLTAEDYTLIENIYPFLPAREIHIVLKSRGRTVSVSAVQQAAYKLGLRKHEVKNVE